MVDLQLPKRVRQTDIDLQMKLRSELKLNYGYDFSGFCPLLIILS